MTNSLKDFATFKRLTRAGSRFSYYPPISEWNDIGLESNAIKTALSKCGKNTALYIHLPFCEQLCSFCGCNIKITPSTEGHLPYIDKIIEEWNEIREINPEIEISELHLGGGTPNFLSSENLQHLLYSILSEVKISTDFYGTIEFDPRLVDEEKLRILREYKFTKAIIGVQDFEEKVLINVNRPQKIEQVSYAVDMLKKFDFDDISLEFIYGLPYQTIESFNWTITRAVEFPVSGIILYPLAVAPWQKGTQSAMGHFPEPELETYFTLYTSARDILVDRGFLHFGFGHFFKEKSPLFKAKIQGELHRNITGFKRNQDNALIGLGVSAISHLPNLHLQNQRVFEKYLHYQGVDKICERSYQMTEIDNFLQDFTRNLICTGELNLDFLEQYEEVIERPTAPILEFLGHENLIKELKLTPMGMDLLKTVCLSFV
jgi:oxygen-independent coproporphyrinogen III oxidase